jgi:hypothetical protein
MRKLRGEVAYPGSSASHLDLAVCSLIYHQSYLAMVNSVHVWFSVEVAPI